MKRIFLLVFIIAITPEFVLAAYPFEDDCSSLTNWTDNDQGSCTTTQTTFDSKSTFSLATESSSLDNRARITQDIGTISVTQYIVQFDFYIDAGGDYTTDNDYLAFRVENTGHRLLVGCALDGVFISDDFGATLTQVSGITSLSEDTWYSLEICVDFTTPASATCDVYLDDALKTSDVDCSNSTGSYTEGLIQISGYGKTTGSRIYYINNFNVADLVYTISGTFEINGCENTTGELEYLIVDTTNKEHFAFGTTESDGTYSVNVTDTDDEYCGAIITNSDMVYSGDWATDTTDGSGGFTLTNANWTSGDDIWALGVDLTKTKKTVAKKYTANASHQVSDTYEHDDVAESGGLIIGYGFGTTGDNGIVKPVFDFATGE